MTDQAASPHQGPLQAEPREDARDLLARLYREIGISAVAAALSISIGREPEHDAPAGRSSTNSLSKKDIAA